MLPLKIPVTIKGKTDEKVPNTTRLLLQWDFLHRDNLSLGSQHEMGHGAFLQGLGFFCCVDVIGLSNLREGLRVESVSEWSPQGQPGLGVALCVAPPPDLHLCCGGSLSGLHEQQMWVFPETWWHVLKATSVLLAVSEALQWNSRAWKPSSVSWGGAQCLMTSVVSHLLHYIHQVILMLVQACEVATITVPL